ncbi:MAG: FAD/NAD(P)-binding protein [Candidatus Aenigmarchaeota archaeon]|nr:FAD/NAD(P)-binding protein [Candidatus Aenigmarchaeota archaeon]
MQKENYVPKMAKILGITRENSDVKTFKLKLSNGKPLNFKPGQFVQVSVFGVGEAAISMCSSPYQKSYFELTVRNVGNVTGALFNLKKGDLVGIRGPYGNGFPVEKIKGKDIVMVAGGVGFPPIKSVIEYILKNRKDYGSVSVLYGARDPKSLLFMDKAKKWKNINFYTTIDKPSGKWKGDVGVVTTLFDKYSVKGNIGISCGPPIMMKFAVQSMEKIGIKDRNIYISLERRMQCGTGKCGHCNIGNKYVCEDGPVFSLEELDEVTEMIWQ